MEFLRVSMVEIESVIQTGLDGRINLSIEVQPSAKREAILGINKWRGRLQIAVRAEAKKGAANTSIIQLLSAVLKVPSANIRITQGATSRQKLVGIDGLTQAQTLALLKAEIGEVD